MTTTHQTSSDPEPPCPKILPTELKADSQCDDAWEEAGPLPGPFLGTKVAKEKGSKDHGGQAASKSSKLPERKSCTDLSLKGFKTEEGFGLQGQERFGWEKRGRAESGTRPKGMAFEPRAASEPPRLLPKTSSVILCPSQDNGAHWLSQQGVPSWLGLQHSHSQLIKQS